MSRYLDAGLDILDRHIVDADGEPVGKVDDLELAISPEGRMCEAVAILIGPEAYGYRLGGRLGRWIRRTAQKIGETKDPIRIPLALIDEIGVTVKLRVRLHDIEGAGNLDRWLAENFVYRIPGARDAAE